jgi:transketolase
MRNAFAHEILELARKDPRVVVLSADIGNRLFDKYKAEFPDRFYNTGVAEANTISMAAGLAAEGFRPVCYTITPFITYRCYEQIRIDICYHEMPVIVVGTGSGLSYASLGPTHHSCEDLAVMRALPGMKVAAPADAPEVKSCLHAALGANTPVYIRIGKKGEPVIHQTAPEFSWGRWNSLRSGSDICILSTGNMIAPALALSDAFAKEDTSVEVINASSVKPLDEKTLASVFERYKLVVSLEEHSLIGGFGSAVGEWLIDQQIVPKARFARFGTGDYFLHALGEQEYARKQYGLDEVTLHRKISALYRK